MQQIQEEEYVGDAQALEEILEKPSNLGELVYCEENVEKILDELRPYLISDGGNVALKELDGPIVKV